MLSLGLERNQKAEDQQAEWLDKEKGDTGWRLGQPDMSQALKATQCHLLWLDYKRLRRPVHRVTMKDTYTQRDVDHVLIARCGGGSYKV